MITTSYPSDLTDAPWKVIHPELMKLIPTYSGRQVDLRRVLDALAYRLRTGVQWRYLPHDFPSYSNVFRYFREWIKSGVFEPFNALIVKHSRTSAEVEKAAQLTLTIVDAQVVKSGMRGQRNDLGFAEDKRVLGIKRHVATDSDGRVLACVVTAANCHDGPCIKEVCCDLRRLGYEGIRVALADAGYRGQEPWCAVEDIELRVVTRAEMKAAKLAHKDLTDKTFAPLPKRWVNERTFGILSQWRALRVSNQRRSRHSEAAYLLANPLLLSARQNV